MQERDIVTRVAETVRIPPERLTATPPVPAKLKIELTARCDLRCYFCSLTYKPRKKADIDPALFFKIVREAKELAVRELGLFWLGEPLLVEALPDYVAFAKQSGIPYVFITTNGRTAFPEKMKRVIESGVDSIKFSLNAGTRERYQAVTGVDAFDQVVANIRSTRELRGNRTRPKLYASTAVEAGHDEEFGAVHALIGPDVDSHYPLRRYGPQETARQETRTLESMLPCWSLFTEAHISYEGHLSACFCDHDPKFYMGDLTSMSLQEAWLSPKFVALRQQHLEKQVTGGPCAECIAYAH